ncbi:MAG: hypothetical protein IJX91_01735 [Clostridia bacterium]|nr:hypothetical protein [Clostridia bacterium]
MDVKGFGPVFEEFEKDPQKPVETTAETQTETTEETATPAPAIEQLSIDELAPAAEPIVAETAVRPEFSLPESDYNKKGSLKKVRGRMMKKLLKYEFRAIFPALFIGMAILLGLTVLMIVLLNVPLNDNLAFFTIMSALLYVYTLLAVIIVSFGVAIKRYDKNFFKEEGYLTFSIPASMEEHVLAKHLSGAIATLIGIAASLVSLGILFAFGLGDVFESLGGIQTESSIGNPVSFAFELLEGLILFAESLAGVYCVAGALTCWGQKFKKKRSIVLRVLIVYVLLVILESVFLNLLDASFIEFFYTTAGTHVWNWLQILLYAGVIALSVWYELRTLKKKLNLK